MLKGIEVFLAVVCDWYTGAFFRGDEKTLEALDKAFGVFSWDKLSIQQIYNTYPYPCVYPLCLYNVGVDCGVFSIV